MRIVSGAACTGAAPARVEATRAVASVRKVRRSMAILLLWRKCGFTHSRRVDGQTRRSWHEGQKTKSAAAIAGRNAHALAVFVKRPQAEAQIGAGEKSR